MPVSRRTLASWRFLARLDLLWVASIIKYCRSGRFAQSLPAMVCCTISWMTLDGPQRLISCHIYDGETTHPSPDHRGLFVMFTVAVGGATLLTPRGVDRSKLSGSNIVLAACFEKHRGSGEMYVYGLFTTDAVLSTRFPLKGSVVRDLCCLQCMSFINLSGYTCMQRGYYGLINLSELLWLSAWPVVIDTA